MYIRTKIAMSVDLSSIKVSQETPPAESQGSLDTSFIDELVAADMMGAEQLKPIKDPETLMLEGEQRIILLLYNNKFGPDLSIIAGELTNENLQLLDLAQLKALREKCDKILGSSSGLEVRKKSFNAMLYAIERVCVYSGLHCQGLTGQLLADDQYQKDLSRLALKYLSSSECSAEVCVSMKLLSTVVQLHANNEIKAQAAQTEKTLDRAESSTPKTAEPRDNIADVSISSLTSKFGDL